MYEFHVYWNDDEANHKEEIIITTYADIIEKAVEYMRNPHTASLYIYQDGFPTSLSILTYIPER